ncbi:MULTISPECIES: nicotinamide riboside transporter PnuC [Mesonia]|uniref:Nicotinamide riboside transporter PnuC n=1 Tax=Mesonia oceanica TaxID=2687242 RepID=A0AC61YDZ1_9FLAO|nr:MULTISPECIES: nicotinamide riboside transporter PnuC [Mesonia]MAN28461.1 nicotinamide mononucleotide transporter [Mesonia sp.]MAQ40117.1 nicotinamide mononucleotide transporter [Mesonia sp.]MBJ98956.1 nicotinamide mononucleotide transporter [Flavobacteriaceae bacterium]VVV01805.1 Nicotinamide riboside transporter PnuC [Mesonia oceanica]|tara:strand:- start:48 stop:683 length:636 start_codon:yes stop_codon:yes gene_type:complete
MNELFDWLFAQYEGIPTYLLILELFGVVFGILSVVFSKMNNIWVYPTGIISTLIYVYILQQYGLLGDMLINVYYFSMSIYGWYVWTRKVDGEHVTPITKTTKRENIQSVGIFFATMLAIVLVYEVFDKWEAWYSYTDIFTTAIFFVGMWLMAKKKIENWIYWIVGDIISVPLYFYKGLMFSTILYLILTIIAIYGYFSWKKLLYKKVEVLT